VKIKRFKGTLVSLPEETKREAERALAQVDLSGSHIFNTLSLDA